MSEHDSTHADAIADCVLAAFDALPAHRKPRLPSSGLKPGRREWVPLAGIVLESAQGTLTCAALATGMKCLPRDKIEGLNGNVIHDSHAEILALRAFNRFLLDQSALLVADPAADNVLSVSGAGRMFGIGEGFSIHMYCSEAPCGDASMELTMAQQDDQSPWTSTATIETESDELFGRGYFGTLGVVRRKPARPDAPPTSPHDPRGSCGRRTRDCNPPCRETETEGDKRETDTERDKREKVKRIIYLAYFAASLK